jgi:Bacterial Ig-like domain
LQPGCEEVSVRFPSSNVLAGCRGGRVSFVATTLAAGALAAGVAESLFAAPVAPAPLARDEEFVIRFSGTPSIRKVLGGGIRLATPPASGVPSPRGTFVAGRPMIDPANGRSVVVRPEAVREYFQIVEGLFRADAAAAAERLLDKVERTGKLELLAQVDQGLRTALGPLVGTRLDDPDVWAIIPSQLADTTADDDDPLTLDPGDSPLEPLRTRVAGDDARWRAYLVDGDINAFAELSQNSEFERFFHPVDASTGVSESTSVLRQREHRRVLMRRTKNLVSFLPEVPSRADLSDAGYAAGTAFNVAVNGSLRGIAKDIRPFGGGVVRIVRGLATLDVAPDTGDGGTFLGGLSSTATGPAAPPRVVNQTPPNGESFIDPTTDWEDPDNQFTVPIPQRRYFVYRLRFDRPLDPRTVNASTITVRKVASLDAFGNETPVNVPVAAGVFLLQKRLGEILVEVTPETNLDPQSRYGLVVSGDVKSLDGTKMGADYVSGAISR